MGNETPIRSPPSLHHHKKFLESVGDSCNHTLGIATVGTAKQRVYRKRQRRFPPARLRQFYLALVLAAFVIFLQARSIDPLLRGVAASKDENGGVLEAEGNELPGAPPTEENDSLAAKHNAFQAAFEQWNNKRQKGGGKNGKAKVRRRSTTHARSNSRSFVDLHSRDNPENESLDLGNDDPAVAARQVMERIGFSLETRLTKMFEKAKTADCRAKIGEHLGYFVNAIGKEVSLPFTDVKFENECDEEKYDLDDLPDGMNIGDVQNRTYQPPRNETEYIDDPENLQLLYGVLTHDNANATIRLIEALHEEGHSFVVHVDGKPSSEETYEQIAAYASTRDYVHILSHPHRVRVNWGGFSMVNATMQILKYAFAIDRPRNPPLKFHKFVHIASTSYPIKSNTAIRRTIASYPLDANMVNVVFKPTNPSSHSWHYFVECDDAVHRIYRLPPQTEDANGEGIDLYTSSQWFVLSREFAKYLAQAVPGTFVHQFLEYAEHVVVADETFFGTVLRNTPFCHKHHNDNFLHVQFDRWENEIKEAQRDERKCLFPDPDHCGRSPTTMTLDYVGVLELSGYLFARKFLDEVDSQIKDVIDLNRAREDQELRGLRDDEESLLQKDKFDPSFEGHGVLIVARETIQDETPLCLGLGDTRNKMRLVPCFQDWVLPTLAVGWETGAVIEEETVLHNRWDLGPCSSDGNLERLQNGTMKMTPGMYSPAGPRCLLRQMDGLRAGRCVDGESERTQPGGEMQVFPCTKRWHQFVSFGNGTLAPMGSMHTTVPEHIIRRIESTGYDQHPYMCVGVMGRGNMDEEEWGEDQGGDDEEGPAAIKEEPVDGAGDMDGADDLENEDDLNGDEVLPLKNWNGEQVITTKCSNVGAVIDWVFVPYIVEDTDEHQGESGSEEAEEL